MIYHKPAITYEAQIQQLEGRGLQIPDRDLAKHYLARIGYYRLAGYWWPLQSDKVNHVFKPGSSFDQVIDIYNFDRELRLLLFGVIEKIEISLRTKLIYHLSREFDPWWFQNTTLFIDTRALIKTLSTIQEELDRSKDTFIKEHKKKYADDMRFPPAWKTLEITSFGTLSKLYGNLRNNIASKDIIAEDYLAVNHTYLPSWLQSIAQIRNLCAHHCRLWNKNLPGTVKLLSRPPGKWVVDVPDKQHEQQYLYVHLCIMKYMLNIIQPNNQLTSKLQELLTKYPHIDSNALGMKANWQNEPLWS